MRLIRMIPWSVGRRVDSQVRVWQEEVQLSWKDGSNRQEKEQEHRRNLPLFCSLEVSTVFCCLGD